MQNRIDFRKKYYIDDSKFSVIGESSTEVLGILTPDGVLLPRINKAGEVSSEQAIKAILALIYSCPSWDKILQDILISTIKEERSTALTSYIKILNLLRRINKIMNKPKVHED